jgi:hypothetical protein
MNKCNSKSKACRNVWDHVARSRATLNNGEATVNQKTYWHLSEKGVEMQVKEVEVEVIMRGVRYVEVFVESWKWSCES